MADIQWSINKKKWDDAIQAYRNLTHKTLEEVTLRQTKNLLFFVSRNLPTSKFKKTQPVTRLSDYFRYNRKLAGIIVGKALKKRGGLSMKVGYHTHRGVTGRAYMRQGARGRMKFAGWANGGRATWYTKEEAVKKNQAMRKQINSRFGFIQLIPLKAVERLKQIAKDEFGISIGGVRLSGDKPNKKHKGAPAAIRVTKGETRIDVTVLSTYEYKRQTTLFGKPISRTAKFYDDAYRKALPRAINDTIADIQQYIQAKLSKRKISPDEANRIAKAVKQV